MIKRPSINDTMNTIAKDYAHKVADWEDSANYAFMKLQFENLKEKGEDPRNYEVVYVDTEWPDYEELADGMKLKITKRFRLRKFQNGDERGLTE